MKSVFSPFFEKVTDFRIRDQEIRYLLKKSFIFILLFTAFHNFLCAYEHFSTKFLVCEREIFGFFNSKKGTFFWKGNGFPDPGSGNPLPFEKMYHFHTFVHWFSQFLCATRFFHVLSKMWACTLWCTWRVFVCLGVVGSRRFPAGVSNWQFQYLECVFMCCCLTCRTEDNRESWSIDRLLNGHRSQSEEKRSFRNFLQEERCTDLRGKHL